MVYRAPERQDEKNAGFRRKFPDKFRIKGKKNENYTIRNEDTRIKKITRCE